MRWLTQFRGTGSLDNQERPARDGTPHSGRPRVKTEEVIAAVLQSSVEMSPKRSLRHRSQSLGLSKDTLRRILTDDLDFEDLYMIVK